MPIGRSRHKTINYLAPLLSPSVEVNAFFFVPALLPSHLTDVHVLKVVSGFLEVESGCRPRKSSSSRQLESTSPRETNQWPTLQKKRERKTQCKVSLFPPETEDAMEDSASLQSHVRLLLLPFSSLRHLAPGRRRRKHRQTEVSRRGSHCVDTCAPCGAANHFLVILHGLYVGAAAVRLPSQIYVEIKYLFITSVTTFSVAQLQGHLNVLLLPPETTVPTRS